MVLRPLGFTLSAACVLVSCAGGAPRDERFPVDRAHRFTRKTSTTSPRAARLFEEGLLLCYAVHHDAAAERFSAAVNEDPGFALAHWGLAYAAGPHINNREMTPEANARACREVRIAESLDTTASPVERALIRAIRARYTEPLPADRSSLDKAYAAAMRDVYGNYPSDNDVAVLYAEALMDLHPWDLYDKEGNARAVTPEILAILERVLAVDPLHPQANHLLIHAVEASNRPERALPAANRLRDFVPEAGHLVHMPAHIDIRLGHYPEAIEANRRAVEADKVAVRHLGRQGFHALYRAHNYHFLVYAAMFDGQSALALSTAREMIEELPPDIVVTMPEFLDGFLATPYHVMDRFGLWEVMLAEPKPEARFPVTTAFWHYSRALALAALGREGEAEDEQRRFLEALSRVPETSTIGNNSALTVLAIGRELLAGEILFRRQRFVDAFLHLREAVRLDNDLAYDEPWGWMVPASHALGALLLEAGAVSDAEQVYRQDLKRHAGNGWALHGLAECLERREEFAEAAEVRAAFARAWARADVTIPGSCYCRRTPRP